MNNCETLEQTLKRSKAEVMKNDGAEVRDEIIVEAVNHFIMLRTNEIEDEPRYLAGDNELKTFALKFQAKADEMENKGRPHTTLKDLHVGIVEEMSFHNDNYYEIARTKYYETHPEFFCS